MATKTEKTTNFSDVSFTLKEVIQIVGFVCMALGVYFAIVHRLENHETEINLLKAANAKEADEKKEAIRAYVDMQKDFQKQNNEQLELLKKIANEKDNTDRVGHRR